MVVLYSKQIEVLRAIPTVAESLRLTQRVNVQTRAFSAHSPQKLEEELRGYLMDLVHTAIPVRELHVPGGDHVNVAVFLLEAPEVRCAVLVYAEVGGKRDCVGEFVLRLDSEENVTSDVVRLREAVASGRREYADFAAV